jgi:hypothetical protein
MDEPNDPQFWHDDYRHHCDGADRHYADGTALAFFDVDVERWFLAHANLVPLVVWRQDETSPHPLLSRFASEYRSCMEADFCPWCGLRLVDDPDFAAANALYELSTQHARWRKDAPRPRREKQP